MPGLVRHGFPLNFNSIFLRIKKLAFYWWWVNINRSPTDLAESAWNYKRRLTPQRGSRWRSACRWAVAARAPSGTARSETPASRADPRGRSRWAAVAAGMSAGPSRPRAAALPADDGPRGCCAAPARAWPWPSATPSAGERGPDGSPRNPRYLRNHKHKFQGLRNVYFAHCP